MVQVTDESGVLYPLGPKIASGGQGVVYRVVGHPDLAIKLLTRREDLDRVRDVRRLPLEGLNVAAPTAMIDGWGDVGYVMRLADDMKAARDPYLPNEFGEHAGLAWYVQTGGLKRRLKIAAQLADTFAALHGLSLAYVDLNPGNVMVSEDLDRSETWLIDTDNLTSAVVGSSRVQGLPGYLAPERARQRNPSPPTTLSDAYSLAVFAFRMLTLSHPLAGTATEDFDGQDAREKMDLGEFPYIGDPENDSNRALVGTLPLHLVLSRRLARLCDSTFIEGRLHPEARPGSAKWRDVLYGAWDNVVTCAGEACGWSYYRLTSTCPLCGTPTGIVQLLSVHPDFDGEPGAQRETLAVSLDAPTVVEPRHLWGRFGDRRPVLLDREEKRRPSWRCLPTRRLSGSGSWSRGTRPAG
jgi:DNA-binding helix-hairpin-helix protein with protein kinase domain